jgi:hypothetical protein
MTKNSMNNTDNFDIRPAAVDAWLKQLPLAHLGETARQLYLAMRSVNRQDDVAVKDYFNFLEGVSLHLTHILPELHKHYVGKPLPLSTKRRKISDLYTQLLRQSIDGYQRVIASSIELSRFGWKKIITTAVHRILFYHSLMLCNFRLLYMPFPRGTWQRLYWLFQLIDKHDLLDSKVQCLINPDMKTTLDNEFKKLLLINLLSPSLFKMTELQEVLDNMDIWVSHTALSGQRQPHHEQTYAFITNTDMSPGLVATAPQFQAHAADLRYFDITPLIQFIQQQLNAAKAEQNLIGLARGRSIGRRTAIVLLNNWGRPATRDSERRSIQGHAELAIGMSAIHYLVSEGRETTTVTVATKPIETPSEQFTFTSDAPALDSPSSFNLHGFATEREEARDIWDSAYFDPEPPPPSWTDSIRLKAYHYLQARIVNISRGGFCVAVPQEGVEHIQTSELIAARGKNGQWQLGEIRWMVCPAAGPIRAGIKRLSSQVKPTQLHIQARNHQSQPIKALMGENEQRVVLFLPALPTRLEGKTLALECEGQLRRFALQEAIFSTPTGSAHYVTWSDEKQNATDSLLQPVAQDKFAAVWASL